MTGIYKITNKNNGMVYIGQATDLERRISEHKQKRTPTIDDYINVLGVENFSFETIEECELNDLDKKEQYYIDFYDSKNKGYNIQHGGANNSKGEGNGRAKLSEQDVIEIRIAYNNHEKQKDVFEKYQEKVSWSNFQSVWQGRTWVHVMPEVYTEENKDWYKKQSCQGEKSSSATLSNQEVIQFRKEYVSKTAKEIYDLYQLSNRLKYSSFQKILWGESYTNNIPVYKKSKKQWYLNGEPVSTISESGE